MLRSKSSKRKEYIKHFLRHWIYEKNGKNTKYMQDIRLTKILCKRLTKKRANVGKKNVFLIEENVL